MDLIAKETETYHKNSKNFRKNQLKSFNLENISFGSFDITNMGFDVRSDRILLFSGKAFEKIIKNKSMFQQLKVILFFMNRVIGFEFNINSRANLVQLVKKHQNSTVAAIGKGYMDLGMITEANIGIQYSNNQFRLNYGDVVIGNLQVLKNLIFRTSGEIYRYNLSLVFTLMSVNLLFGYLIWMNQFMMGFVFSNILKDNQYLILNIIVYTLCLSQSIFRIRTNLNVKKHRSFLETKSKKEK